MKRIIAFSVLIVLFVCGNALAAGSVITQSQETTDSGMKAIIFTMTAAASGAYSDTAMNQRSVDFVKGMYFYGVEAWPTSGGTAPDAADVLVFDKDGEDLLGSEDGGTTAYQGLNLIHATRKYSCIPDKYLPRAGTHQPYYPPFTAGQAYTLRVQNQGTGSANVTVRFIFAK